MDRPPLRTVDLSFEEHIPIQEKITKKNVRRKRHIRFNELPPVLQEQFQKLKSSAQLGASIKELKSILFFSYKHGEGTSTIAANFAESLAQTQNTKILIVDGNTRTPCLHQIYNLDNRFGFSEIFNESKLSKIVKRSDVPNLFVIPSGQSSQNLPQIFDHTKFNFIMEDLKKEYDFIIFDSSPVGKYYDSVIIASHVNYAVLVVQAGKTPWNEAQRAKQMFEEKNIPILGSILNRRRFFIPGVIFERFFK